MVWNRANEERKMWYLNHLLTHDFSYKEMKVLNIGSFLLDKYKNITQNFISDNKKILKKKTIFDIIYGTIIQIVSGIIIGVSTVAAIAGKILVGNVISIIRALSMVQSSSRQIMMNIYAIYSNSLYMDNLFSFIHDTDEASENEGTKELKEDIRDINLNNVSFSYDNKKNVVDNVSLHLEAGKRVAIVGPNGSGKSTLLKLITGLYEPVDGKICINGTPIPELKKEDYYKRISVLFQDYVKYEFTLRENIGVGDYDNINNDEKILKDLKTTKTDFLKDTNGKVDLNMQLGNWFKGGRNLSQGQWQKIALARAYFKDASCYILDEPNAALDTVSEREVFDKFFSISKDHIGIYISHRLNAAKMADEIIVMSNGKIVDIGTHDKLLDRCGVYQELYEAESYEQ